MVDWELVDELAADLGVKKAARVKWRQRGQVPYRWRLPLIEAAGKAGRPIKPEELSNNGCGKAA